MTKSFYENRENTKYGLDTTLKSSNAIKTASSEMNYFCGEPNMDHSRTLAHQMVKRFGQKEAFNRCKKNHWNQILNIFSQSSPPTK